MCIQSALDLWTKPNWVSESVMFLGRIKVGNDPLPAFRKTEIAIWGLCSPPERKYWDFIFGHNSQWMPAAVSCTGLFKRTDVLGGGQSNGIVQELQ